MTELYECEQCGACCYVYGLVPVQSFESYVPRDMVTYDKKNSRMTMKRKPNGACIALDEQTGLCTIHDNKPITCRLFDPHPAKCADLRTICRMLMVDRELKREKEERQCSTVTTV